MALSLSLAAAFVLGCAKDPPGVMTAPVDASSLDHVTTGAPDVAPDVLLGARPDVPPDAQPTPPAYVMFPDPPQISCAAVSDCEFPPSVCASPSCDAGLCPGFPWVVYYDNPQCVAGLCVFEQRYFSCGNGLSCSLGGCRFNGTLVAAP